MSCRPNALVVGETTKVLAILASAVDPEELDDGPRRDPADAIEILAETGLEHLQRRARAGHNGALREPVAAAVDGPHEILIGGAVLPGHLVAAASLLGADRRPGPKLTNREGGALELQRRTIATAVVQKELVGYPVQPRRARRLNCSKIIVLN